MPFRLGKVGLKEKLFDKLQNMKGGMLRHEEGFWGRNSYFGCGKILGLLDLYLGVGGVWKKCDSCLTNCNFDRPHLGEKNTWSSSHFWVGEGQKLPCMLDITLIFVMCSPQAAFPHFRSIKEFQK